MSLKSTNKIGGISSAAVAAKTGKTWAQWLRVLDKAGAKTMTHKETAAYLRAHHHVGPWWQQMVTVGYEQERGLRKKHQTAAGFSASISRTMEVPVKILFGAWTAGPRKSWLAGTELAIRKATPHKSLRLAHNKDGSRIEVNFYPKGPRRSQVVVQQNKLAKEGDVAKVKAFWSKRLDRLKGTLTSRSPDG